MAKVYANDVLKWFQRMYKEHWAYRPNASEKGCVDCSGAFHYVYEQLGGYMPHGSNAMARKYSYNLMSYQEVKKQGIKAKMVAYKVREPNEQYYNLPEKYRVGGSSYNGDLNDYYHVGLVDTTGEVLNAKSEKSGFVSSRVIEGWDFFGYLKDTIYEDGVSEKEPVKEPEKEPEKEDTIMKMFVSDKYAQKNTTTVNVRKSPSTNAEIVGKLKFGTLVERTAEQGEWSKIEHDKINGWMMTKFLEPYSEGSNNSDNPQADEEDLAYRVAMLEDRLDAYEYALTALEERIARLDGKGVG